MSAYTVTENHIIYLVAAALSRRIRRGCHNRFSWVQVKYPGDVTHHIIDAGEMETVAEFASELWQENVRSVNYRYQNDQADLTTYVIDPYKVDDLLHAWDFDPLEVLKAIDCLEYQSCEHPEWEASKAWSFLNRLRRACISSLHGYSEATWGAPKTSRQIRAEHFATA
jgi:hypothetical protein